MDPSNQESEFNQQPQQNYQNQSVPQQTKYAGFWIRVLANMADGMVFSVIFGLLILIFTAALGIKGLIFVYFSMIVLYFVYVIYSTVKYQATLGKKLVGIMVFTGEGEKATVGKIVLRELIGKMVSSMIFSIGYMMAGFTERKRALHDMIAGTVVVYRDPSQKAKSGIIALIIVGGMIVSGIEGYVFTSITKNMTLKQANSQIEQAKLSDKTNQIGVNSQGATGDSQSAESVSSSAIADAPTVVTNTPSNGYVAPAPAAISGTATSNTTAASPQSVSVQNQNPAPDNDIIDKQAKNKIETIHARLVLNFLQNKTYKGFVLTDDLAMPMNNATCKTITKLDISPDGQSFVIHRPICAAALAQSFCLENGTQIVSQVSTGVVEKTYHCK